MLELLLLLGELLVLRFHPVDLGLGGGLTGESFPGQLLVPLGERHPSLILKVGHRLLEL